MTTHKTEAQQSTTGDGAALVWHNAATWDDLIAALRGQSYTAKCGKRCQGQLGVSRPRAALSQIEKCLVCADLYGVPL